MILSRRTFLQAAGLSTASLILPEVAGASLYHRPGRVQWGGFSRPEGSENTIAAITRMEAEIGRKLDVTRHYLSWRGPFPSDAVRWSAGGQRIPYVAWCTDGDATWKEIIDGKEDDHIRDKAAMMRDWGPHAVFCFEHEPESMALLGAGTPDEFAAAYDHVHRLFAEVGAHNLKWACVLQGGTFRGAAKDPDDWMPMTHHLLGCDGYNRHPDDWLSFWGLFSPGYHKALSQGRPFMIGEWGCQEDPRKPAWLYAAAETMRAWKRLRLAVYTNALCDFNGTPVDFRVDSSEASLAAFRSIGAETHFGGTAR